MKTTSRIQLYERLWMEPKRDVARSFGVTSDRLSRLCRRNNIPIPVQGFWNRGPVQLAVGSRQLAEDGGQLAVGSEEWAAALSRIAGRKVEPLPHPDQDWEISIELSAGHVPDERLAETLGIPIPEKVTRWHPLIRQTRHVLKDCSEDDHGRYRPGAGCLDILVTKASRQRAYRVMDTILRECDAREWSVRLTESRWPRTIVTVEGGDVAICLEEMLKRGPEMFTDPPSPEGSGATRDERVRRRGMQLYPRFPSGRFVLKTDWPAEYGRRAWREGKRFSLEYVLKQFIEDLELVGI